MKIQGHDLSESLTRPKYSMAQLSAEEFHAFWPRIEEMLDRLPHTWRYWTKDHIIQSVNNHTLRAWCIGPPPQAILVFFTSIHVFPAERIFSVDWAAGSFHPEMLPLLDATWTKYAMMNDCTGMEIRGRPGWEPHLKGIGFKREAVVWTRNLRRVRMH